MCSLSTVIFFYGFAISYACPGNWSLLYHDASCYILSSYGQKYTLSRCLERCNQEGDQYCSFAQGIQYNALGVGCGVTAADPDCCIGTDICAATVSGINAQTYECIPTPKPSKSPTVPPSFHPTTIPTSTPSSNPTNIPTTAPTSHPSVHPTNHSLTPTVYPSPNPTYFPTIIPTSPPTKEPSTNPTTHIPTMHPSHVPSKTPTMLPTTDPTTNPSPTMKPTMQPTVIASTLDPTMNQTMNSNTGVNVAKVLLIVSSVVSFVIGLTIISWLCIYKKRKQTTENCVQLINSQNKNDSLLRDICDKNDIKITISSDNIKETKSRLIKQMKTYQNSKNIDKMNVSQTLKDFAHILQERNKNNKTFKIIMNHFPQCDESKCNIFQRTFINRSDFKNATTMFQAYESKENKQIAKYQIMDKIHCFFHHQSLINVAANSNRMNKKYTQLYNMKDMFTSGWEFNYMDKQTQKKKKKKKK
eukprot:497266_1